MAGYEVQSGHLHGSGYIVKRRCRVQGLDVVGSASAGVLDVWDTDSAPIAGTYTRSGTTVTVTKVGHGLSTGDLVGITFLDASGVIATPGNYEITVTGDDTFTLTDINSGAITGTPTCYYVYSNTDNIPARWLTTYHTAAADTYVNNFNIPGDGFLVRKGVYARAANLVSINVYFS
jgi:hypothetical protein